MKILKSNAVVFLIEPEKLIDKITKRKNKGESKKVSLWTKIKGYLG